MGTFLLVLLGAAVAGVVLGYVVFELWETRP